MVKKIQWIEGIKVIAALSVFWGHFHITYYATRVDAASLGGMSKVIIFVMNNFLRLFWDGALWVYVFAVFSGYFASKKEIISIRDLIGTVLRRYIRFVFPIFFTNVFVLFIQNTIGFHAYQFGRMINSEWVAQAYNNEKMTLQEAFHSAFLLTNDFNGSFWIIRPFFVGSCILYVYSYCKHHLANSKYHHLPEITMFILLWVTIINSTVHEMLFYPAFSAVGGVLVSYVWNHIPYNKENEWIARICLMIGILSIYADKSLSNDMKSIVAMVIVSSCKYIPTVHKWLEIKQLKSISDLSFGIFAVHGPLLFSISIIIEVWLTRTLPYSGATIINWLLTTGGVLIVAKMWRVLVGKSLDSIMYHLNSK